VICTGLSDPEPNTTRPSIVPLPPQGNSHIRRMLAVYFRGNAVLVPIKLFILKKSTAVAFELTFRILLTKYDSSILEIVPLVGERSSSHTHKTGMWPLLGVLF